MENVYVMTLIMELTVLSTHVQNIVITMENAKMEFANATQVGMARIVVIVT